MYRLKNVTITIEDQEDQIGTNPDGSPKYQTYGTYFDPIEGIVPATDRLKEKIAQKQAATEASKITIMSQAVSSAAQATSVIASSICEEK